MSSLMKRNNVPMIMSGLYLYASQNYRDLFADFSLLICPYGMR